MLDKKFTISDLPNQMMRDFYQYWLDLKGDKLMPSRADMNPVEIVKLWAHLSLIDVIQDTGRYQFRLIGTETVNAIGKDLTGNYLDEYPEIERFLKVRYDWLVKERRSYFIFDKLKWSEKSYIDYYVLGLPLSSNGHDVDKLLLGTWYDFPQEPRTVFYQKET